MVGEDGVRPRRQGDKKRVGAVLLRIDTGRHTRVDTSRHLLEAPSGNVVPKPFQSRPPVLVPERPGRLLKTEDGVTFQEGFGPDLTFRSQSGDIFHTSRARRQVFRGISGSSFFKDQNPKHAPDICGVV